MKTFDIGKEKWNVKLWIYQPIKNGNVDESKYKSMTRHIYDPLALIIGYMVSGFCYLQFIDKVKS
jgi:uncharacterized protein (UPF0297 family)